MKKQLLFIFLLVYNSPAFAQYKVNLDWVVKNQTNAQGKGPYSEAPKVLADGNGGVYYCGSTHQQGPSTGLLIIHYDDQGAILWSDTLDDTSVDELADALLDSDGKLILAMNSTSPFGLYGIFQIFKYDDNGDYAWKHLQSEPGIPWGIGDMEIDATDDLYLFTGWANHPDSLEYGFVTQKLNGENGAILWTNEVIDSTGYFAALKGRLLDDRLMVLGKKADTTRKYILHQIDLEGNTISFIENDYPPDAEFNRWAHIDQTGNTYLGLNAYGYRLTCVEAMGDTLWDYERNFNNGEVVLNRMISINSDSAGFVYAVGNYKKNDHWVIATTKFNSDGKIIWQNDFHRIQNQTNEDITRSFIKDSILFIMGSSYPYIVSSDSFQANYLSLAYSLDGEELFHETYDGGIRYETASSGSYHQGNLFVVGYNDYPFPIESSEQYIFKYTIDIETKTVSPSPLDFECKIFPNPISDNPIEVTHSTYKELFDFRLFDSSGRAVSFNRTGNTLALGDLSAGVYWLEISWADGKEIHRLVKL